MLAESPAGELPFALEKLGWSELVSETPAAEALLFDELGRAARGSALIDRLTLAALSADVEPGDVVVYPVPARRRRAPGHVTGDTLTLDGWVLAPPRAGSRLVFPATAAGDSQNAYVATLSPDTQDLRQIGAADTVEPGAHWAHITATVPLSTVTLTIDHDGRLWRTALAGLSHGALELAAQHVRERKQFGKPIGAFQAVRHRLADAYASIAAVDALVDDAWTTPCPAASDTVLAYAGGAHRDVLKQCLQVTGAMGLAWEHDLPRYLRRGYALDAFFGPADTITAHLGARLLRAH